MHGDNPYKPWLDFVANQAFTSIFQGISHTLITERGLFLHACKSRLAIGLEEMKAL
jgi:hypothetical protein